MSTCPAVGAGKEDGAEKPGKAKKKKFHGTATHKVYCTPNKTRLLEAIADRAVCRITKTPWVVGRGESTPHTRLSHFSRGTDF